ncbi:dihydrolipoamide acetyltransferase family protein [Paenarthrobacter nitroguajacolicus]|uniref:dihydrolipoamide acetyltransferase family protein n=1 Tax=Paenarthrobacter nitroguajacolicus TaxID=211146 RepID=UPI00248C0030|nr:dihydrolipoamide acetyltransferase family protein [Paenarthrobacter nitroguajacolicus]MDI2035779.1 Dihydrolipoyllysine-residue acyltransferase component of branched-chain alpha-ketoacid dehydrogenase complex [Paenarthrobacter nitroguajacolicus]
MSSDMQVFKLPDLGEGLTEAELVNWLVAVGDEIVVDQPIAEVETAKSMVEVPSPYAGTVAELHGEAGQTLDVGKPLISIARVGASVGSSAAAAPAASVPAGSVDPSPVSSGVDASPAVQAAAETYRTEEKAGSGNVLIGYGTPGGATGGRTRPRKASLAVVEPVVSEPRSVPEPVATPEPVLEPAVAGTRIPGKLSAVISPLVRKMARDHGVSLDAIEGSGASGLIMRKDVEAAISSPEAPAAAPAPVSSPAAEGAVDARTGLAVSERKPVRGVRKAVAANMARSRTEIPEATVWVDVDATALLDMRAELKKRAPHDTPGLLAFIARFVTAGLKKYPALNTRFETTSDGSQEIVGFDGINLGFAAQTDRGLVVPSVRNAHGMSARELDAEIRRLTAVAREGKATPTELGSGTFTLNNYGVFGVDGSAAIINYPEVAMLGVGRIIDKPWVVNGELAVRKVTELTLAFDHRVCDGETAAGFLRYVADAIENPGGALVDM